MFTGSGSLTSLTLTSTGGDTVSLMAIEVDGVILTDGAGKYGKNGFHLDFSDNSSNAALGNDAAGSNNWTVNNLTAVASGATSFSSTNVTNAANILDGNTATSAVFTSTMQFSMLSAIFQVLPN